MKLCRFCVNSFDQDCIEDANFPKTIHSRVARRILCWEIDCETLDILSVADALNVAKLDELVEQFVISTKISPRPNDSFDTICQTRTLCLYQASLDHYQTNEWKSPVNRLKSAQTVATTAAPCIRFMSEYLWSCRFPYDPSFSISQPSIRNRTPLRDILSICKILKRWFLLPEQIGLPSRALLRRGNIVNHGQGISLCSSLKKLVLRLRLMYQMLSMIFAVKLCLFLDKSVYKQ